MEITLHGTVEQLIQRLVQQGSFPNAEAAVSSLLMNSLESLTNDVDKSIRLPDLPVAFDESFVVPDLPYSSPSVVVQARIVNTPRLPDPIFD
jgi:hypothetical protein